MKRRCVQYMLIGLLITNVDAGRINIQSCTAIPGSAQGPSTKGGDAFCGSQRQPSLKQRSAKGMRPQNKQTETIIINQNQPLTASAGTMFSLPTLNQKKLITFVPSQGHLAHQPCSLSIELNALTTAQRELLSEENKGALYQLAIGRSTAQSPSTIVTITNIYLQEPPTAADSTIMLLVQPDGKSYAAWQAIPLPTDLPESAFRKD